MSPAPGGPIVSGYRATLCVADRGDSAANDTPVTIATCTGGANQQWHSAAEGLVNPVSGKCLDDPRFSTTPGTQLDIYTCNGGANQQWRLP